MASSINVNQNNNNVSLQDNNRRIIVTDNNAGTTTNVTQPVTSIVTISALGPQGAQGPQGQPGEIPSTGSFVLTSSFNAFTSSYYVDSASFNINISNNSSSISLLSGSFKTTSGSFSTRITNLENFSSSLDATFATDAELNAATASLSASISNLSSSFKVFSGSYNTGSFTGSFKGDGSQLTGIVSSKWTGSNPISRDGNVEITGSLNVTNGITASLYGTASWAENSLTASYITLAQTASYIENAQTASYVLNALSSSFASSGTGEFTGSFTGSYIGDGAGLYNIPASGIVGLNLSQIVSGSVSASISPNAGLQVNTNVTATSFTGSLLGTASFATSASQAVSSSFTITASFAQTAQTASYVLNAVSSSYSSFAISASYAVSASHEIIKEVSSSYADTASFAQSGDGIFSGSFSGSFEGYGGDLTGISFSTDFTRSLFVTPSGNDSTAVVGDMHKPFATILAATASANAGDTIIVYPGEYITGAQIGKDYVNYYFYPGAVVSGSVQLLSGTYEKLNIRGHGTFKTRYNGAPVGCTANGYFECDTVEFAGLQSSGYAGSPSFAQNVSADPNGILQLKGDYKYGLINGARTGNGFNAAIRFGAGNIIANCNAFVSSSTEMMGIEIATATTTDVIFNGDVYASNGRAVYTNDRAVHVTLTGRFETGNQATYEAIHIVPAYIGRYIVNGEIIGAIRIDAGETSDSGIQIDGFQECSSSPNASAIRIDGGYNTLNHTVRASEIIFDVNGGETHFYGAAYVSSDSTGKLFDISAGKFVWNGMNTGTNIRALSNVVSGGELVINGPLEHYGSSYPNNTECFALSGGTLEINNKVRYHQNTTGSGIVDMSGGYLKLNGAELVHNDGTGSYAPAINLNSGNYSGSILNNSYTNLNVFGNLGTFTNESIGGGTLFYNDKLY
jgi:hypothetical protein